MHALTLWRPWDWAIVAGHKPIENRDWRPWESVIGKRIAIHAGKTWDEAGDDFISDVLGSHFLVPAKVTWPAGLIVGTVRVDGWFDQHMRRSLTEQQAAELRESPWYMGAVGWVVSDPIRFRTGVPCRGKQGLWLLPPDVQRDVIAAERAAA